MPRFSSRASVRPLAAVVVVACLLLLLPGCFLRRDSGGGDWYYNWDNRDRARSGPVDWPLDIVFVGDSSANKDHIASLLNAYYSATGSWKYMYLRDAPGAAMWAWSQGKKRKFDLGGINCWNSPHVRFYADSNNTMHNGMFNYVPATTHYDSREGGAGCLGVSGTSGFGWSEWIEDEISTYFENGGYHVVRDAWDMGNSDFSGWQGDRYLWSDGYATVIYV